MNKWSRKYSECKSCQSVEHKHFRYGYCKHCYYRSSEKKNSTKQYYLKHKKQKSEYQKRYKKENKDIILEKQRIYRKGLYQRMTLLKCVHNNRTNGFSDLTTTFLVNLWRNTTKCEMCNKKLENNASYPDGKQLDHIYPLNSKSSCGLNVRRNIRFICSLCNLSRPKLSRIRLV